MSNPSAQPPAHRPAQSPATPPAAPSPAAPPAPYGQAPAPAPYQAYPPVSAPADSVGSWMVATFVSMIPIVGFIYLIVVAFGGTASVARRNWARAIFAWQLIGIAFLAFIAFTGGLSAFYSLGY